MEGQVRASATLQERAPGTHCHGWVDLRVHVEMVAKRKISIHTGIEIRSSSTQITTMLTELSSNNYNVVQSKTQQYIQQCKVATCFGYRQPSSGRHFSTCT